MDIDKITTVLVTTFVFLCRCKADNDHCCLPLTCGNKDYNKGEKGDQGIRGSTGQYGPKGKRGKMGSKGQPGLSGGPAICNCPDVNTLIHRIEQLETKLSPPETTPFPIGFKQNVIPDSDDWITIQRRSNADINFYRKWAEYERGFGDGNNF